MDLDKIINEHSMHEFWMKDDREEIKQCMRIAAKQALELANNKISGIPDTRDDFESGYNHGVKDSKKSILSIIDEIE